jgi:hypothetical protein
VACGVGGGLDMRVNFICKICGAESQQKIVLHRVTHTSNPGMYYTVIDRNEK